MFAPGAEPQGFRIKILIFAGEVKEYCKSL